MIIDIGANSIVDRMIRAMKLNRPLYAEVEHDPVATMQGFYIIALVSVCQAIGRGLESVILGNSVDSILITGIFGFIETIIGMAVWSYVIYFVGHKVLKATVTPQEVWRCTGFARSPGIFFIIPFVGFAVNVWVMVAYLRASEQALNLSTGRTILVVLISALPFMMIQGFFILFLLNLF